MAVPGRSIYRRHGFGDLVSPERWMERPAPRPAAARSPGPAGPPAETGPADLPAQTGLPQVASGGERRPSADR